jgi:uncharacterized membrane protein
VLAAIVGSTFLILSPPFSSPDESSHWLRAYQLSTGHVYATRYQEGKSVFAGGDLPVSVGDVSSQCRKPGASSRQSYQASRDLGRAAMARILEPERHRPTSFSNTAIFCPAPYLPASLAIAISRWCGAGPAQMFYFGRIATLTAFLILVTLAINTTPVCKWTFLLLALMPMSLYLAAVYSADPITNGLAFLAIALVLRCVFSIDNFGRGDLVRLCLAFCCLALCKQFYVALALLFFLLPRQKFGGTCRYVLAISCTVALPILLSLGWMLSVQSLYVPLHHGCDAHAQLHFILSHPLRYVTALCIELLRMEHYYYVVGCLGRLDVFLPNQVYWLYWAALIVTAYFDRGIRCRLGWQIKAFALAVFVVTIAAVATSQYLAWTPVGDGVIEGFQSRYMIPALPLLLFPLLVRRADGPITRYIPITATSLAVATATIAAIFAIVAAYYW